MLNSGIVALLLLIIIKSINLLQYIHEDIEISHLKKNLPGAKFKNPYDFS